MKPPRPTLAACVVLTANALVLTGVALNRSGPPVETITLSEAEARLVTRSADDTGVDLRLDWHRYPDSANRLDAAILRQLGFRLPPHPDPKRAFPLLTRAVWVVLEVSEQRRDQWKKENTAGVLASRLFVADAGLDPVELRSRYSDPARYLIVRGVVRALWGRWIAAERRLIPEYHGRIDQLLPDTIHVPLPQAGLLGPLSSGADSSLPRYSVTLAYGRRYEPWVVSVKRLN